MSRLARLCAAAALVGAALACAPAASAQDDGPRVYQLAPEGARLFTAFAVAKRGNEGPEPGDVFTGSEIDTDTLVFRYAQTFSLGGRQLNPFVILPMGRVTSSQATPEQASSVTSSGFGDAQVGAVLGLFGSPALPPEVYAAFRPDLTMGLLGRLFVPVGAYDPAQAVNLGANRFALQFGLPTTVMMGQSFRSPSLTALEVLPTVTFYGENDQPFGANEASKKALFGVEAHLTHNLSRRVWISADMLYRQGGETRTDGADDGNATQGWSAGGSLAFPVTRTANLILTYEHVVERNDDGPDGWFFRSALVVPLRPAAAPGAPSRGSRDREPATPNERSER